MLEINELAMIRKMLGISGVVIAEKMGTTRQTVNNIELGKAQNKMAIKFYRMTMLEIIQKYEIEKKERFKTNLMNIIKYLDKD